MIFTSKAATPTNFARAFSFTTLTLDATAVGSVHSGNPALNTAWNPVSYSDQSVLDLTMGQLDELVPRHWALEAAGLE